MVEIVVVYLTRMPKDGILASTLPVADPRRGAEEAVTPPPEAKKKNFVWYESMDFVEKDTVPT